MEGYSPAVSFVKNVLSDRCAEKNALQMSFGPKIAGSSSKGKGPNDMDVSHVEQEQDQAQGDDDWSGGVYSMFENLMAAINGSKGKGK